MNVLKALYMKAFHGKCATDFLKAGFRDATTIYGFMGFLGEGSTLNPYRRILEKIQNAGPSPSAFTGK